MTGDTGGSLTWLVGVSCHAEDLIKPLSCWTWVYHAFANSVDPDQLASSEANWSGSALFVIQYVN